MHPKGDLRQTVTIEQVPQINNHKVVADYLQSTLHVAGPVPVLQTTWW